MCLTVESSRVPMARMFLLPHGCFLGGLSVAIRISVPLLATALMGLTCSWLPEKPSFAILGILGGLEKNNSLNSMNDR